METIFLLIFFLLVATFYFFLTFNPIESVLWLMLTCASLAFYLFLANVPFFSSALVILYVSAVTVLFVYVILMLPSRKLSYTTIWHFFIYLNIFLFVIIFLFNFENLDIWVFSNGGFFADELSMLELSSYFYTNGSVNFVLLTIIFFSTLIGLFLLK